MVATPAVNFQADGCSRIPDSLTSIADQAEGAVACVQLGLGARRRSASTRSTDLSLQQMRSCLVTCECTLTFCVCLQDSPLGRQCRMLRSWTHLWRSQRRLRLRYRRRAVSQQCWSPLRGVGPPRALTAVATARGTARRRAGRRDGNGGWAGAVLASDELVRSGVVLASCKALLVDGLRVDSGGGASSLNVRLSGECSEHANHGAEEHDNLHCGWGAEEREMAMAGRGFSGEAKERVARECVIGGVRTSS